MQNVILNKLSCNLHTVGLLSQRIRTCVLAVKRSSVPTAVPSWSLDVNRVTLVVDDEGYFGDFLGMLKLRTNSLHFSVPYFMAFHT